MVSGSPTVTMKGKPLALTGHEVEIGQMAPDAILVANDLSKVALSSLKGKKVIVSAVPSLDTPVCDLQTKRFNQEASRMGDDVVVLTVSMDLPFAQARWCGATGSKNVRTLSDYQDASFGRGFGVLLEGLRLLARAVFVIDAKGVIRYKQIVSEITHEPDYEKVLTVVRNL